MKWIFIVQVSLVFGMQAVQKKIVLLPGIPSIKEINGTITPHDVRMLKEAEKRLCRDCFKNTVCAVGCAGGAMTCYGWDESVMSLMSVACSCFGLYCAQKKCRQCGTVCCYRCKKELCCQIREDRVKK